MNYWRHKGHLLQEIICSFSKLYSFDIRNKYSLVLHRTHISITLEYLQAISYIMNNIGMHVGVTFKI